MLSLQALRKMYLVVVENLRKAWARDKGMKWWSHAIKPNDLVTLKVHMWKTFDQKYGGSYRVLSIKGNQASIVKSGNMGRPFWVHISHLKQVYLADKVINKILDYSTYGRKTTLPLHPDNVPDLQWQCTTTLNTHPNNEILPCHLFLKRGRDDEKGRGT